METIIMAKALVIDRNNNCLVLRRSKTHPRFALQPDLPGGWLEQDEAPTTAVCREIVEETGITIDQQDVQLLFTSADIYDGKNQIRFLFVAPLSDVRPAVSLSMEHAEYQWIPLSEVVSYLEHPVYKRGAKYIIEHKLIA